MAERRSIYFTDHTVRLVSKTFESGNLSNKVNANIDRYHAIITDTQRQLALKFSPAEMNAILTLVKPTWNRQERAVAILVDFPAIVERALRNVSSVNSVDLTQRISALPVSHILCLVEAIENEHAE